MTNLGRERNTSWWPDSLAILSKISVHEEKTDRYEMSETNKTGLQVPENRSRYFDEGQETKGSLLKL